MQTIKTAVVVVLLLVVLYLAYITINGSQTELPPELQNMLANDSEMDIDVSMNSFDSSGLTPGSGLKSDAFIGANSGKPAAGGGLTPVPPPVFGTPNNSTASTPQTLVPPKLTSIPNFPSASDDPPSGFSLNLDKKAESDSEKETIVPLPPPSSLTAASNSLDPPSSFGFPGMVASQATPTTEANAPFASDESKVAASEPLKNADLAPLEKKTNVTGRSFDTAKKSSIEQIDRGEFKEALAKMSAFYNSPELTAEQNLDLINLLDTLAGETIYSRRHLLDTPYIVGPGETVEDIAKRFEIPSELLAKINAVDPSIGLLPGTKMKVFRGPFRAEVDVNRHEMTVFLGELYAGRFPISTGSDPQPKDGVFQVLDKQRNRNYYGKGGIQIDGHDPRNPYGGWWMDLGQELSIHGSPDNPASDNNNLGCISLSPLDAGDVFSMLSRGSQVTIKR